LEAIIMKRTCTLLAAAALLSTAALAQPGYGPGMMGGGYGPGMMGGGPGYGPGMMGGWGPEGPGVSDLSADQRKAITEARQEFWKKQWPLMQQMHAIGWNASDGPAFHEKAARKDYDTMAALDKQMFENRMEMRKRMEATLTPKQREELRRGGRNW